MSACAAVFARWQEEMRQKTAKLAKGSGLAQRLLSLFNRIMFPPKPWKLQEKKKPSKKKEKTINYAFTSSNAVCRIGVEMKVTLCDAAEDKKDHNRMVVFPQSKGKTVTREFGCNCRSLHGVTFDAKIKWMRSTSAQTQRRCLKKHVALSTGLFQLLQSKRRVPSHLLAASEGSALYSWLKYNVWIMGPQVNQACNTPKEDMMRLQKALMLRAIKEAEADAKERKAKVHARSRFKWQTKALSKAEARQRTVKDLCARSVNLVKSYATVDEQKRLKTDSNMRSRFARAQRLIKECDVQLPAAKQQVASLEQKIDGA